VTASPPGSIVRAVADTAKSAALARAAATVENPPPPPPKTFQDAPSQTVIVKEATQQTSPPTRREGISVAPSSWSSFEALTHSKTSGPQSLTSASAPLSWSNSTSPNSPVVVSVPAPLASPTGSYGQDLRSTQTWPPMSPSKCVQSQPPIPHVSEPTLQAAAGGVSGAQAQVAAAVQQSLVARRHSNPPQQADIDEVCRQVITLMFPQASLPESNVDIGHKAVIASATRAMAAAAHSSSSSTSMSPPRTVASPGRPARQTSTDAIVVTKPSTSTSANALSANVARQCYPAFAEMLVQQAQGLAGAVQATT